MKFSAFGNMDAAFCGISDEEAGFLRQQDEDYLKAVNVVPIKTAISCHKRLKSLRIELENHYTFCLEQYQSPTGLFFLSRVTALVSLRQMPHLDFQLRILPEHAQHLEHLKPFVKVLPAPPERIASPGVWEIEEQGSVSEQLNLHAYRS